VLAGVGIQRIHDPFHVIPWGDGHHRCRQRKALVPRDQKGGDTKVTSGGITHKGNVIWPDVLGEKPVVCGSRVMELRRIRIFRRIAVVQDQGPAAYRLGHMGKEFPVGVHTATEKTTSMEAKENPVRQASFRVDPHRRNPTGIRFYIVYTAWLGGEAAPSFPEIPGGG